MPSRSYQYVGPADIKTRALASSPMGTPILSAAELATWIDSFSSDRETDGSTIATFTVSEDGVLFLAPRRSEHVACAGGYAVSSAGEITFSLDGDVLEVTNQSTGYCPEPESWPAVATALDKASVIHPGGFTTCILFRLCLGCNERNIIKDNWFVCDLCGSELPEEWNFARSK